MAYAELTDVRCYYEVVGDGDPLLLVPGLGTTCRLWDAVVPDLARQFSLILVDNRNVGRSIGRRPPQSVADLAADLVELLDELQVESAHVMGVSLGGIIAQRLAIDHPSRVNRLVLVSTAARFTPYLRAVAMLLGRSLRHFPREAFVRTVELLGTAPQFLDASPDEVERRVRAKCGSAVPARALAEQLRCLSCSDVAAADYRIAAPTLVVAGEHDAIIPNCYSKDLAGQIPGGRYVVIKGAGHNPLADYPEQVVPGIAEFLGGGVGFPEAEVSGPSHRLTAEPGRVAYG